MTTYLFIKYYKGGPEEIRTNDSFMDLMNDVLSTKVDDDFLDIETAYGFLEVISNACMDGDSEAGYVLFEVRNNQQFLIAGA